MRTLLMVLWLGVFASSAWAGVVCLDKQTGKLIEYQSNATPGTLIANAKAAGIDPATVEEKVVTDDQWLALKKQWIDAPSLDAQRQQRDAVKARPDLVALKQRINLSDDDLKALKELLNAE